MEEILDKILLISEQVMGKKLDFNNITSLHLIEMIIGIEDEFEIEFEEDDIDFGILDSYEKMAEIVSDKLSQKESE